MASYIDTASITICWTTSGIGYGTITGYEYGYKISTDVTYTTGTTVDTCVTITGLIGGDTYDGYVKTICFDGECVSDPYYWSQLLPTPTPTPTSDVPTPTPGGSYFYLANQWYGDCSGAIFVGLTVTSSSLLSTGLYYCGDDGYKYFLTGMDYSPTSITTSIYGTGETSCEALGC